MAAPTRKLTSSTGRAWVNQAICSHYYYRSKVGDHHSLVSQISWLCDLAVKITDDATIGTHCFIVLELPFHKRKVPDWCVLLECSMYTQCVYYGLYWKAVHT